MGHGILLIAFLISSIHGARVSDKIYEDVQGNMACFKRFNGTHEVGCTSDYYGNVGVLYIPDSIAEIQWAVTNGTQYPYIIALEPTLFTRDVMMIAKHSGHVKGIVILDSENSTTPDDMSPASTCPSHEYGMYNSSSMSAYSDYCPAKNAWNSVGSSLLFESFDFPVFLIQDEDSITAIRDCYDEHSKTDTKDLQDWPLCALQLHSNMFGTTNSEVCLRRKAKNALLLYPINYCDPIHDYNIIASLNPMEGELENSSVIVVAARADAASMFDNISPGADAAVSGLVTLLAIAEAMGRNRASFPTSKNVMFVLFEGETWDYLGSTTMTYDMNRNAFPFSFKNSSESEQVSQFNFDHIDFFLEVSQMGIQINSPNGETKMYLYNDPLSDEISSLNVINNQIKDALVVYGKIFNVSIVKPSDDENKPYPLPPSSFQSFLKYRNVSGTVMSDHDGSYTNMYYQSFLDDYQNVNFQGTVNGTSETDMLHIHLSRVASTVASAVFALASENVAPSQQISANDSLVSELLVCYLRNVNCTLFREHAGGMLSYTSYFQERPAKMYTSVLGGEDILTNITLYLMGHFLGTETNEEKQDCWSAATTPIQKFFLPLVGENGTCYNSTARLHSADSPAFTIEGYDYSSGQYPSWTESGWSVTKARLFLKPNPREEIGLVVGGVVIILVTFVISYWANLKAETLFVKLPAPAFC